MDLVESIIIRYKSNENICPRCGRKFDGRRDKSIQVSDVMICSRCGLDEAIRDYSCDSLELSNWFVISGERLS